MKIKRAIQTKYWGAHEGMKELYEWVNKVNLNLWNILIKDPIAIRNFLTQYTDYTSDKEQFGYNEYWQNPNNILHTRNDDCEGINNLACNILFTLGYDCRLSIGRSDFNNGYLKPKDRRPNHAYGLLFLTKNETNPYIIECTGNDLVEVLPKIDSCPEYYTWYMGSGVHKKNYVCNHLV